MVTSSKRLFVMTIFINLLMAYVGGFYFSIENDDLYNENMVSIQSYENITREFEGNIENVNPETDTIQLDKSVGDPKAMGGNVWEIFKGGISYGSTQEVASLIDNENDVPYKKWLWYIWISFMAIINIILVYEAYLILVNKKQD